MILNPINQLELLGLDSQFLELISLHKNKKLPNKILLSGTKGSGKCTLAFHLINYILSLDEDLNYDFKNFKINEKNKSHKLILNKTNPNFYLIDIKEDKKNIDINQIRNLIKYLNKSTFNRKPRIVLIDNIEFLNINSINALLKVLEEPGLNVYFILINNNKKIPKTLTSRCLNYKINLPFNEVINVSNKLLGKNVKELINNDLINHYMTPGDFCNLLKFAEEFNIDLKITNLFNFIKLIIDNNYYKKDTPIKYMIFNFIELFFFRRACNSEKNFFILYNYFIKIMNNYKRFNIDEESFFLEFNTKVLNG